MDFRHLRYLCAVAEHRSITKAAAALYISQPSLSHFIAKVERELGIRIFDRSATPLALTYAGEAYLRDARRILDIHEGMNKRNGDMADGSRGRIRLGMPWERAAYMLPQILPQFQARFPLVEVALTTASGRQLTEQLSAGKLDIIVLPQNRKEDGLTASAIYDEELVLVTAPEALPGVQPGDIPAPEALAGRDFILLHEGHALTGKVEALFVAWGIDPPRVLSSHSNITSYRLAAAGLGFTIVPRMTTHIARCECEPDLYPLGPEACWRVAALMREGLYVSAAEQAFIDIARAAFHAPRAMPSI